MKQKLMGMTDQCNDEIAVFDLSSGELTPESKPVWRWSPTLYGDLEFPAESNHRLDSVTLRTVSAGIFSGNVMGVTKSGGMVAVLEFPSGKCLFNADASGYGPHDIDILPNGCVAVACSGNGNEALSELRIYRAGQKNDAAYVSVPFFGAHGVLWDPAEEVLWCLGHVDLCAYRVKVSFEGMPILSRVKGKGLSGFRSGHCLSPVYGNPDRLWISDGDGVYQFSKSANALCIDYPGKDRICVPSVKSVNNYADGTVIMTVADPDNKTAPHNSDTVRIFRPDRRGVLIPSPVTFPERDFYKVRVIDPAYQ